MLLPVVYILVCCGIATATWASREITSGYVNRDGVMLYYVLYTPHAWHSSSQKTPTTVFVHGDDVDHSVWKCQQEYLLQHGHQSLAIDMRGFGKSSKPPGSLAVEVHRDDLHYLLMDINTKVTTKIYLVGWSLGGAVVQSFAAAYPYQVAKLVLTDTTPQFVSQPGDVFPYGRTPAQEAQILATVSTNFSRAVLEGAYLSLPESCVGINLIRAYIAELIVSTTQDIAFRQTADAATWSGVANLTKLTMPTLIFVGRLDYLLNPLASVYMRLQIPNSELFEFPSAGHSPLLTFKDTYNTELSRFLFHNTSSCQLCLRVDS